MLAACDGPGIGRDEAIVIASRNAAGSTVPLVLVSAFRRAGNNALELRPEDEARYGYVWVVTFRGAWTGEGVAGQPPPEYHTTIITVDAESGEIVGFTGTN